MKKPFLIDTTLRDGEQAAGVVFSLKEKMQMAAMLDESGIREVEIGYPSVSNQEAETIKTLITQRFRFQSTVWCRALVSDIEIAKKTGASRINISVPGSAILLASIQKSVDWLMANLEKTCKIASDSFDFVSIGIQDASRSHPDLLFPLIENAVSLGVNRIRLADTVGIMTPLKIKEQFEFYSNLYPQVEFEFHGHNDLGMATANTLTALECGATCASATVNGLGERAGNAALEEVAAAMQFGGSGTNILNLKVLTKLAAFVAKASGRTINPHKPITGQSIFEHESGIHCRSLTDSPLSYQPFLPSEVGNKSVFIIGKHSGVGSIHEKLEEKGIHLTAETEKALLFRAKQLAISKKAALTENELLLLINELN
jgi:homocitrate synthase NifV